MEFLSLFFGYSVFLACASIALVVFYLWHTANTIGTDITLFRDGWRDFDCVAVHTYCPKRDTHSLPLRGRLTIHYAYLLAQRSGKPILLAVGNTVASEKRMESQIYADFLKRNYGFTNVILGTDPDARDTVREANEMHRLCETHGFKTIIRFGIRPHLARISWHWNRINRGGTLDYFGTILWYWFHPKGQERIKTYFVGVYCPVYLYLFEVPFFVVDMGLQLADLYLPKVVSVGLRNMMLRVINRRGPKE
ncbi:MAG: hypothetical protein Q7R93_03585 [bacterium]|nr:hypothetical protein [bacterium]